MERRDVLKVGALGASGLVIAPLSGCAVSEPEPTSAFSLGVASGLHSSSEVVLWTRLDPRLSTANTVTWEVGSSAAMTSIIASGTAAVSAAQDYCVKVLVGPLAADTSYWYRFSDGTNTSTVGRARTLPQADTAVSQLKLAFTTCQHFSAGYYQAWRAVAAEDVDAVLFLGDYIYEIGLGPLGIRAEPFETARTLSDYRSRYRLYKSDPDLQAAHAAHPFIAIWDDHEVFNDHDRVLLEADPTRATQAHQAWFEYLPVWPIDGTRIYRTFDWGSLAKIMVTDSRQYRDAHLPGGTAVGTFLDAAHSDPNRTQLGTPQRNWLLSELTAAQTHHQVWKLIGNQTMIAPIRFIDLDEPSFRELDPSLPKHAGFYSLMDSWDGFPAERDAILAHIDSDHIDNVNFLTGDFHAFFQATVRKDFDDESTPIVANEFTVGAISSPSFAYAEELDMTINGGNFVTHPTFNYADLRHNGYATLLATPSEMVVTYYANNAREGTMPSRSAQWRLVAGDPTPIALPAA